MEKNIIVIDCHKRSAPDLLKGCDLSVPVAFAYENTLTAGGYGYKLDAIVIASNDSEFVYGEVLKIRTSQVNFDIPIFTTIELNTTIEQITDGVVKDYYDTVHLTDQIQQLSENIPPAKLEDLNEEERLTRFLFTRPGRKIVPVKEIASPKLYRYPLLDAFSLEPDDFLLWRQSLIRKQILQNNKMVDRIRMCPSCNWAHLYFVDQCPRCSSVDIHEQLFLHCFTCGNVEPQERFIQQNSMSCPKCHTILRHLGADYDRAMENYHCHDCSFVFVDPVVTARCLNCEKSTSPDHLDVTDIHEMSLSEKGRISVITGRINDIYAVLDGLNFISMEYFLHTLDWHIKQALRYKTVQFSLMLIKILNIDKIVAQQGHSKTLLLVETFANHLRSLIRDTDLSVRSSEDSLMLYLPYTPYKGATILKDRMIDQKLKTKHLAHTHLDVHALIYTYPDDYIKGETAEMIQMRMNAEVT